MNKIIKVLNKEHGKEIIKYLEELGYSNKNDLQGSTISSYYGLIKGIINYSYNIDDFDKPYEITELPKYKSESFTEHDLINSFISFKYNSYHYEGLVIKENDVFYILNNIRSNNDGHKDKSIYKYSLSFVSINKLLRECTDIKILNDKTLPRYVELLPNFDSENTGRIFDTSEPIPNMQNWNKNWTWEFLLKYQIHKDYFKPSTKEAFDAQDTQQLKLNEWLNKYKKLNLAVNTLADVIEISDFNEIFLKLKGTNSKEKAKILYDLWNQSESIEKWSVGSYVVFLQDEILTRSGSVTKGNIYILTSGGKFPYFTDDNNYSINFSSDLFESYGLKWFATKSEAENFAKTLTKKDMFKKDDYIQSEDWRYATAKKQAVHCTTQKEWDFVQLKCNKNSGWEKKYPCSVLVDHLWRCDIKFCKEEDIQILSFQEWCDINNYKMEEDLTGEHLKALLYVEATEEEYLEQVKPKEQTEFQFEVGKYYKFNTGKDKSSPIRIIKCVESNRTEYVYSDLWLMSGNEKFIKGKNCWNKKYVYNPIELSIEEVQQYLPDRHPDKIKSEFKVGDWVYFIGSEKKLTTTIWVPGKICKIQSIENNSFKFKESNGDISANRIDQFRHATPEEINNHLIPIRQIPAGEPLNTGIEPNESGMFKYKTGNSYNKEFSTNFISTKPKTILTIDDEELPMVSIIKTKTINLLNNE